MDMIVDDKPDLVDFNEQLGNSKTDFDNITETAQDIEQSLDGGIKSCDVTVVSEHSVDENVKSLENRMYNFSDSVVSDKVCEEDIDSNYTLVIENVQERNDKGERCKDMESIVNEVIEFLDKEDDNIERFKNIDDPDASLSARSEDAVKEDSWMMSNKGGEQDSHIYVEKSQIECWNSASGATEGVQLGPSNDGAPRILECPVSVRLEISAGNEFSCSGNENTSGSNSDQQENDLLKKLDEQSSSLDPLEEHKKLIIPKKEVTAVGDLEGCEISYSSQLEQAFPMASEASYGDVGKEKTVQNANRNMCHSSTNKCSLCETVCLGQARMVSHMRVHTGERPFDCGVCGLNFKHQENLKRHQKTHESSKQRNTTSPKHKQIRKTLEQRKRSNSEYMDLHEPFQSSVVKSRDKVQCMPQTEGIKGCSASKDNFTDSNVCKETEVSASVKDNVDSHCSFLKGDERKLICSVDEALSTEQSTVEIFACSVVLDKINLQGQDTEVYLKHHTKEKLTTNIMPVKIHCPLGSPTNSKTNADKGGSTDSVEKNAPRGEGVFKCPLCNKSYSHKRSLNKHIRHVHPDHWHQETVLSTRSKKKIFMCKYKCEKCDFRFFSTAGLIRHQNRFCSMKPTDSSEEKRMSTSQSNQKVRGKEALRQNRFSSSEVESGSGNKKTNICRFCGRIFSRRINLCQHEQMHIRKKLNVAISETEQGSFSSTSQNDLSPVNSDELSDAPKQHKCKFCGRMFLRRINLFQHEQMHIRKKLNAVKSEAEKESFSSTSQNDHSPVILDELSDASKEHKCKFCGKMFPRWINLFQHVQMHIRKKLNAVKSEAEKESFSSTSQNDHSPVILDELSDASKQHKCKFCGRIFSRRINLRQHEQVHVRERLNTTKSNAEHQSFSSALQNHQSPVNSDKDSDASKPKTHKCKFCGRMFSRRINLIQHEQVHKRRKQVKMVLDEVYLMESCDKKRSGGPGKNAFKISSLQINHKCRFCARKFFRRCNLCQHERVCHRRQIVQKQKFETSSRTKTHNSSSKKVSVSSVENPLAISNNKFNKCQYCRKIFSTKSNLNRHVKLHKQKNKFLKQKNNNSKKTDDSLYAKKKSPETIINQVRIISTDNRHPCQQCGKWFTQKLDLSQHLKLHCQKSIQLEQGNSANNSSSVKSDVHTDTSESGQNFKKENINKTPHICRFCGRLFARRINLCQHERVCHRRQVIHKQKFENSNRTKTHNSNLKKVSVSFVENPLRVIYNDKFNKCQYCRKIFSTKSNLNRHVKLHKQKNKFLKQKNNNSKKTDDSLDAKRKSHDSIRNQVRIISTDNWHPCQQCGKWFTQKLDLSQHLKLHCQKSIQLEQGNSANNSSSVKSDVHTDTSESGQNFKKENINKTPHICRFCGRLFARRINLCQHERVCHRRQIIRKQKPENSNRTKTHNSNLKKVSVSSVENPLSVISNNKFNKCQYCRKIFSTKSNLNRHVKLHKQKKKFLEQKNNNSKKTDDSLDAKRKSHDSIRNQVRIISADNWHSCQYCGKWFPQKLDLSHHLKLHIQKSIQLEQRNTANSSSSVITDLRTDTSESGQNFKKENIIKTPHICRFCGRLFARRINLCQHEQWHKQKDGKVFKENNKKATHICRSCGRCFDRRVNLCQHERWHSQKNGCLYRQEMVKSKPFQAKRKKCRVCSKTCTNKSDLLLHYESRHTENLKCQICNTLLGTYVHLRKHMRTHVELSMVDMKEQSHRKRAKYTNASHFHKKTKVGKRSQVTGKSNKVTKSKKYKCTVCGMSFNNHSLLFLHKKKHTMSAHACFVCGKIFTRKFDLARHLQIHTGDQPHECDICLEGFRCRVNLAEHMGTHVLREANEFQCDGCKALFCDQQSILNHLELAHTSHHKVSHLGTQIINNDNELQGNEHASGSETIESDSVINYIQSKKPIFSCGICGEAFEEASHLCVHMGNHVSESTEIENGKETGMTVKAESYSPNRQMDIYKQSCKLENHPSHNDMQNSQGHVCLSDFVDAIKNETVVNEVSSLDGEGNIFDHATDSLSDEYIDEDIGVDPSESISEFLNVKHHSEMDEKTVSVDHNGTNIGDITKILDYTELNKNFKCGLCMHTFSSKQGLSQHKRWHASTDAKFSQMKKDYCTVCKIYFASKSSYTLHLNWHKSGLAKRVVISDKISIPLKPYRCEKCGKTFTRKDSLAKHKCMMHYSQDDGVDKSRSKVAISKGVMKTVVPNGFRCDVCGCSYAQRACLVQHLLHKHNLVEKHFKAVCDEKEKPVRCQLFLNNAGLTSHNTKNQKRNQKSYKCIFCKKQYVKKHAYLLHTSRVHPSYYQQVLGKMAEESSNKKKCKYCKIWYNPNDNSGHKDGFNCRSCEKIFPCKGCFIQHLDLPEFSELEGGFWCCVCRIKFSNRNELEEHVPLHATDHGKYNCRMCSQVFKYKQHLFRHEKVHRISMQYSLKESYACKWCNEVFPFEHAMHLHEKTKHGIDHKTSRKPKKRQVLLTAESYNCTNLTNAVEVNMASPAGVGSDIFSSSLPRQYDAIALDQAYCKKFFTKAADETICKNDQGKKVVSNLGSLEAFPMSIKQEPVDLCDNSVCGSTCTSPVKEVENNGIVHNSDFDTSIPDSPFLNRVGSDTTKFDLSPSVQLNERVKQDDIQRCFEDSDQDEVDIDDIHDGNSSPIDRSDVLYFVGSTMATGQNDSLDLLKEVLEKPAYSEAQSSHKSPPDLVKAAFKLPIPHMESSNKNDNSHSCKPLYLEDSADDASMDDLLEASKNPPKYLKQTEDVLRKDASDHSQEHLVKDDKSTTSVINQESKEQRMQCIICCKMVYSHELVRHLQSHADLKLYECKHCDECFLSAMSYSEHMEKNYGEIVCCACGETFTEKEDLIMHVKKHNFDVVLNCSICGAIFTSNDTFSKHLEFHIISEAKSAETRNDNSDDVEIISSEDREEEEENLRALMEDQGDADMTLSSVITSSLAAWKQMSLTFLSEGSVEAARKDDSATEIIVNPGELLGTCKDAATSEDIKPDINKLHDIMSMQNAYMNMEAIMGCNQTILDGMVQNSTSQVGAEPINTVSGTPLDWYSKWKKLAGKITGSEHTHQYDRGQKEQCQAAPSTSSNRFPIRTELREPDNVPVIKKEFFEQDTQLLLDESERPRTTGSTGLMQPGLKPCYVKLEKIDCEILTCRLCHRILVTENALKLHYFLHLIPGYEFS